MEPTVFAALKIAIDALRGIAEINKSAEIEKAVSEAKSALLDANNLALGLQESAVAHYQRELAEQKEILELREQLKKAKEWRIQASCYVLRETYPQSRAFVRELDPQKAQVSGFDEPIHWLCPNCYYEGKCVILRPKQARMVICTKCSYEVESQPHGPLQTRCQTEYDPLE